MLHRAPLAAAVALLIALPSARAADEVHFMIDTAGDLARLCAAPLEHPNRMAAIHLCHGYILGAHHFHTAIEGQFDDGGVYCVPAGDAAPSRNQVAEAFAAWALETPGIADQEALDGLMAWANATYPCAAE